MKRNLLHIALLFAALLVVNNVCGQGTSGEWSETTLNSNKTLNLTGNITVKGTITIPKDKTLTINPNGKSRKITVAKNINQVFKIESGGTLKINGTAQCPITIDGGAKFSGTNNCPFIVSGDTYSEATASGYELDEAILNENGTLTLEYVTICNVKGKGDGGAIYIGGKNNGENRPSTLTNCYIYNCYSTSGSAIHINTSNSGSANAENCKLEVKNSTIYNCYSHGNENGTGEGGTIRTNGSCTPNLYFINTTVRNNYTRGSGCGIYWNGKGTNDTKCVFDGCTFENNVANNQGGAMMLETNFEFESTKSNKATTIKGNKVIKKTGTGGGIVVTSYGGTAMAVTSDYTYTFTYDLSDKLIIDGNSAAEGAGISFNLAGFSLNSDWNDNNDKSRKAIINLNLVGAIIQNNKATNGNGGGIRFYNNTKDAPNNNIGKRSLEINVKLNKGTIANNTATGGGAGIYLYNAEVSNSASTSDELTINSNVATGNGGGLYVDGGKTIDLKTNSMEGNQASQGAAIYLSGGSGVVVTLGKTTMSGNVSTNEGGALYVNGGNLTISGDDSSFINNKSTNKDGGFAYVSGTVNIDGSSTASSNTATKGNGGCFYVASGNLNVKSDKTLSIQGNSSNNGGAVYLNAGNITVDGTINAGSTTANTATEKGGAIYLNTGNFNLNNGTFANNTAKNGGAIYMGNGTFALTGTATLNSNQATDGDGGAIYLASGTFKVDNNGTINVGSEGNSNSATNDGGGIYCAGTFSVDGKAIVCYNRANNGGGICVENGAVTIAKGKGSEVNKNEATANGGGLYVNNSSTSDINVSFNGGAFSENKAQAGGAVCAIGNMNLGFSADLKKNIAENGGGIYMADGVKMTFNGGLIVGNQAITSNTTALTTAYYTDIKDVYGVGGGIFMGDNTTLTFSDEVIKNKFLGIYDNVATYAAADIYASGKTTEITNLPNTNLLDREGYKTRATSLYWAEDYVTDDTQYATYGINKEVEKGGNRYQTVLVNEPKKISWLKYEDTESFKKITGYACLDLGYDIVFITLTAIGLDTGEYAEIQISNLKYNTTNEKESYIKVLFSGTGNNENISKVIGLPSGSWNFTATNWMHHIFNAPSFNPANEFIEIVSDKFNGEVSDGRPEVKVTFTKLETDKKKNIIESYKRVVNYMK